MSHPGSADDPKDLKSQAAELARKVLTVGVGAIFLTEENLRNLVADFKLPKELLAGILDSAGKTKNDFLGKLSSDMLDRVMTKVDVQALAQEILSKNEIELDVKIRFKPKSDA